MTENTKQEQVMILTRRVLDLKLEKKEFNASQNKMIKDAETKIKFLVKEE